MSSVEQLIGWPGMAGNSPGNHPEAALFCRKQVSVSLNAARRPEQMGSFSRL